MALNNESKYPTRRAYVIKLRHDATPDVLRGRIENIVTCRQYDFTSSLELLQLIVDDLEVPGTAPDTR